MDAPIIKTNRILDLPRGENNPRNSEGDFALLNDGRILFAYSRYCGQSNHDDAECDIKGLVSDDGGKTFRPLDGFLATAKEHGTKNIMSVSLARIPTGELCLFYLVKRGAQSEYVFKKADKTDETRFSEAETCFPCSEGNYYVVNNCRVAVTPEGRVIIPAARHKIIKDKNGEEHGAYFGDVFFFASDDGCKTWRSLCPPLEMPDPGYSGTGLQEPGAAVLPDGRLYGYFRTDRCFQFESFSSDGGLTWSVPVPSRFTSPDSPMLIKRNPFSGVYYALWNPVPNYNGRIGKQSKWVNAGRTPFVIAQSENGADFSPFAVIEDDPEHGYCYPALMFTSEKEALLSYCCGGPEDDNCLTRTRIVKISFS